MLKSFSIVMLVVAGAVLGVADDQDSSAPVRHTWLKGVWVTGEGTYTVYSQNHYFVVSLEGNGADPNIYCGASQIVLHPKGIARAQRTRLRRMPGGELVTASAGSLHTGGSEVPLSIDTTLFIPGMCTDSSGVLYDAIMETGDDYLLLSTCNEDRIKIYREGRYGYLPASGGEYFSFKVEEL